MLMQVRTAELNGDLRVSCGRRSDSQSQMCPPLFKPKPPLLQAAA